MYLTAVISTCVHVLKVGSTVVSQYFDSVSSLIVTLSQIQRRACARVHFSVCSSTTNARSETGQMTVCCQNLTLGALSSRSALTVLVGALFKKFGLFLNTPRIKFIQQLCIQPEDGLQSRNMSLLIIKVVPRLVILYSFIKRKRSVPYM